MTTPGWQALGASHPVLCLVADAAVLGRALEAGLFESWLSAGIDWVHVRDRSATGLRLFEIARAVGDAIKKVDRPGGRLLVNRRVDVAIAAHAGGAHLGFDALEPDAAGSLMHGDALIGVSTHSLAEVVDARTRGADYVHLSPIYEPLSKALERPPLGLEPLREACSALGIPVFAQGGITPACCADIVRAGAAGIAVTGAIAGSSDPAAAARALRQALDAVV